MGRVARYKKVKACDPFAKGNKRRTIGGETVWGLGDDGRKAKKRSRTAEKLRSQRKKKTKLDKFVGDREFDAPPDDGDEFDMNDLMGSVKKREVVQEESEIIRVSLPPLAKSSEAAPLTSSQATSLKDETTTNRLLKLEKQVRAKNDGDQHQSRMEGESKTAYRKRMANETRQIIRREKIEAHNPEKRKRKKEFLTNKKKAKKGNRGVSYGGGEDAGLAEDEPDESTLITGEQAYAKRALESQVQFGEQAERPPSFKQLPRKATMKSVRNGKESVRSGMAEADIAAEQAEMELMRRKVRAQYALIKAKRHHAGDFHL